MTLVMGIMMVNAARVVDLPFLQTLRDQQQKVVLDNAVKVSILINNMFVDNDAGLQNKRIELSHVVDSLL
jgi:hypothetical protein